MIVNLLELTDGLNFSLFKKIDTVREYRNKIIHQNPDYVCTFEHCATALAIAIELALEGTSLSITLPLSIQLSGA